MTCDPWLIATGFGNDKFRRVFRGYMKMCHPHIGGRLLDLDHRSSRLYKG
jgi:hypothetical protein